LAIAFNVLIFLAQAFCIDTEKNPVHLKCNVF